MRAPAAAATRAGAAAVLATLLVLAGCGQRSAHSIAQVQLRPDQRPAKIGRGPAYRLPALSPRVARRAPIEGLSCTMRHRASFAIHLELFAHRLVLPVASGIGVAPPQRRSGAYVIAGACSYPLRTFEPTGVVRVDSGHSLTLGKLFAVWGQPLSREKLASFRGPVSAYVGGRRWAGDPRAIPLRRHAEIVLETGGYVIPHPGYGFPPGV